MSEENHKLEKRIFRKAGTAITDFNMIEEGDKVMVAVSGGKDSWVLLYVLNELKKRAPIHFDLVAVNIDQGYEGFRQDIVEDYLDQHSIENKMEFFDIATLVEEKSDGAVPCSLCSRLRRGALYGAAQKLKCNKIALGHHQDDMIETLLLNIFFVGTIGAMAPILTPENPEHSKVIRPLIYVSEDDIRQFTKLKGFPVICCQCPLMCGEDTHADHKRRYVKKLLSKLEKDIPDIKNSLLASLTHVKKSHLLDKELLKFIPKA